MEANKIIESLPTDLKSIIDTFKVDYPALTNIIAFADFEAGNAVAVNNKFLVIGINSYDEEDYQAKIGIHLILGVSTIGNKRQPLAAKSCLKELITLIKTHKPRNTDLINNIKANIGDVPMPDNKGFVFGAEIFVNYIVTNNPDDLDGWNDEY